MAPTNNEEHPKSDNFRDRLSTIDDKGKRFWIFAKKPKGKLTTYRNIVGIVLLAFLFIGPFLKINGQEFLLLNFLERKFVIFGTQFWPQDFTDKRCCLNQGHQFVLLYLGSTDLRA